MMHNDVSLTAVFVGFQIKLINETAVLRVLRFAQSGLCDVCAMTGVRGLRLEVWNSYGGRKEVMLTHSDIKF